MGLIRAGKTRLHFIRTRPLISPAPLAALTSAPASTMTFRGFGKDSCAGTVGGS